MNSLLLKILRSFVALKVNERREEELRTFLFSFSHLLLPPSLYFFPVFFRDERRKAKETEETRHESRSELLLRGTNEGLCIKFAGSR